MKRFNKLLAGASWMAEYGNPDTEDWDAFMKFWSPYQNLDAEADYPKSSSRPRPGRPVTRHARKMCAGSRTTTSRCITSRTRRVATPVPRTRTSGPTCGSDLRLSVEDAALGNHRFRPDHDEPLVWAARFLVPGNRPRRERRMHRRPRSHGINRIRGVFCPAARRCVRLVFHADPRLDSSSRQGPVPMTSTQRSRLFPLAAALAIWMVAVPDARS